MVYICLSENAIGVTDGLVERYLGPPCFLQIKTLLTGAERSRLDCSATVLCLFIFCTSLVANAVHRNLLFDSQAFSYALCTCARVDDRVGSSEAVPDLVHVHLCKLRARSIACTIAQATWTSQAE